MKAALSTDITTTAGKTTEVKYYINKKKLLLYPRFKRGEGILFYLCLSICQSLCPMNIFVAFFSGTTIQGLLKFGFRVYIYQLYCVVHFQIHHSTTSCLPNTCIIIHIIPKLKIFITFFSGTTIQGFLKFGFKLYICQLYRVMCFQIHL